MRNEISYFRDDLLHVWRFIMVSTTWQVRKIGENGCSMWTNASPPKELVKISKSEAELE